MPAWAEYRAGTCPTNPVSVLRLTDVRRDPAGNFLLWWSVTSRFYAVDRSTNLLAGWETPALTNGVPGNASETNSFVDPATGLPASFYRIRVNWPP